MVKIADFNTMDEAMMASGMLKAHGIDAIIGETGSLTTLFPPGIGTPGVPMFVQDEDAAEARCLLEEHGDL